MTNAVRSTPPARSRNKMTTSSRYKYGCYGFAAVSFLVAAGAGAQAQQPPPPAAPAPATQTQPALPPPTVPGGLNLNNASLFEVINLLAQDLHINYILDSGVKN